MEPRQVLQIESVGLDGLTGSVRIRIGPLQTGSRGELVAIVLVAGVAVNAAAWWWFGQLDVRGVLVFLVSLAMAARPTSRQAPIRVRPGRVEVDGRVVGQLRVERARLLVDRHPLPLDGELSADEIEVLRDAIGQARLSAGGPFQVPAALDRLRQRS